ncbi:MAG: hypothetical protein Q9191_001264 [Dirinaria sp. TL-2023a]
MIVPETKLLWPKDPRITDSDDWPSYVLRKVKVLSKATGEPVSLLAAHDGHPVKVSGTLEAVEDEHSANVKDDKYRSKTVELDDITTYAFAEYNDGTYGFWAAGKAGWFELKDPAPAYKDAFAGMNEAASMFYMLADKLRRSHKTHMRLSNKALERYANSIFKDDTVVEVESRMARNRGQPDPNADYEEGPKSRKARSASNNGKQKKHLHLRRQPRTPIKGTAETADIPSTSDDEVVDFASPQGTSRKRKSILQPKGSKYSKKATGRRQSLRPTNTNATDDFDEDQVMEEISPLASVAPRNATTSKPPPKKHSSALDDYASHHEYLPRVYTETKLVQYKIPSAEPQGPGDLWTCSFESCRHRVHAGSTADGQARINDHLKNHVESIQAKIDLALEESRPYLPVNNLVRRLQQFNPVTDSSVNTAQQVSTTSYTDAPLKKFPQRIKRSGY